MSGGQFRNFRLYERHHTVRLAFNDAKKLMQFLPDILTLVVVDARTNRREIDFDAMVDIILTPTQAHESQVSKRIIVQIAAQKWQESRKNDD